jgi:hypothetical protein
MNRETEQRFRIFDVSDPANLREVEVRNTPHGWGRGDFTVIGDFIYVIDEEHGGLLAYYVSEEAEMQSMLQDPLTHVSMLGTYMPRAAMSSNYVAASGSEGRILIDLHDPDQPRQIESSALGKFHFALSGRYLLAVSGRDQVEVRLFDLEGGDGAEWLAGQNLDSGETLPPDEDAEGWSGMFPDAFARTPTATPIVDSAEPEQYRFDHVRYPSEQLNGHEERAIVSVTLEGAGTGLAPLAVFDIEYGGYSSSSFYGDIDEARQLLVTGNETLRVFDVSVSPAKELGALPLEGDGRVTIHGNYAYRAIWHAGRIDIIDLSDRANPRLAATREAAISVSGEQDNIAASDGYLYVVEKDDQYDTYVQVYDLSDPLAPEPVDRFTTSGTYRSIGTIQADGDRIVVAGHGGIHTFRNVGR